MPRSPFIRLVVVLAALSGAAAITSVGPLCSVAHADDSEIDVGTELLAVKDVQLHKAVIGKGSKVSVFRLQRRKGALESVDVQLADGHVVPQVAVALIRSVFRVSDAR